MVSLLLDRGADIESHDDIGLTPLHRASKYNKTPKVVELLLDRGNSDIIEARDHFGRTPLHEAGANSSKEVVALLLGRGADINAHDFSRRTPLYSAISFSKTPEVVELMLSRRADINARDNLAETPLHWASHRGTPEVVSLLLREGADVKALANTDVTPLHLAAIHEKEVVRLLLDKGAAINAKNKDGETPLHCALHNCLMLGEAADIKPKTMKIIYKKALEVFKLLLKRGADTNAQDKNGDTPLHWAVRHNNARYNKVISLLLKNGADRAIRNKDGKTPFDK